jgi:DNA primase
MARDAEIQEILLRVDLVDLIGSYLKLTRAGRSFKGLCPFHQEKTPSFHVYPSEGMRAGFFHCFGCKKGGDAINFLIEREGLSYQEVVEQLARRAGMEPPRRQNRSGPPRKNRYEILNQVQTHFRSSLRNPSRGEKARQYLLERAIPQALSDQFGLGYATDSWEGVVQVLGRSPEAIQIALEIGLIRKRETEGHIDFFRNRLMFPIQNSSGEIIAFAGRDLSGESQAKYMNTPETDLFKKGRVLYGLHQAREVIRQTKRAIVVEGYFDVLRMHQAGFGETIAPMGTALTVEHLSGLERLCEEIILLFDGDNAGRSAALRSLQISWDLKTVIRVVHLPPGHDPDDFLLSHSAEEMRRLVEHATPAFTYLVDQVIGQYGTASADAIRKVVDRVFESLGVMKSETMLEVRLKELSEYLGIPHQSLRNDYEKLKVRMGGPSKGPSPPSVTELKTSNLMSPDGNSEQEARKGLCVLLLQDETSIEHTLGATFRNHTEAKQQLDAIIQLLREQSEQDHLATFLDIYLREGMGAARTNLSKNEEDSLIWEVEAVLRESKVPENPLRTLTDYANALKKAELNRQIEKCKKEINEAEKSQEWAKITRLAPRLNELVRERNRILSVSREVQ